MTETVAAHGISFAEATRVWLRVALLSFGGPAGQIAVMHRILVEEKKWISESRFMHALNYCMLLPGPEAQQLATYIGWLLHRTAGGLVAGTLFVLPGVVAILILSILYAGFKELTLVQAIFFGIKAAVLAIVVEAVIRIGKRALKNGAMVALAAAAFVAIFFLDVPFPLVIIGAGLIGYIGGRVDPERFAVIQGHAAGAAPAVDTLLEGDLEHARPSLARAAKVLAIWLPLWLGPLAMIVWMLGPGNVFSEIGVFFSKMAVVTFGGAYAVLAYVAQEAVQHYRWLTASEMLDGLGMAETTPGPLIMVLQFVGFLAAFRSPGTLNPYVAGVFASVLTTWVTFTPCFLWIFLGAPYVERLRGNRALSAALSAITAAVVGVILNLAVWFALHLAFGEVNELRAYGLKLQVPVLATVNVASVVLAAAAFVAMLRFKVGMMPVIAASAMLGALYYLGAGARI
ncbi:MAG TPA: chromate efflux transporter [Xanthobacteraceae bacterium]|nr:chromate efflux transporter [Xanthobacteraceae bacterium]